MQEYCIYGTVYNNNDTLEESIKSFWRPDSTIVITDNFSTDGTWEKLKEISKEFNLLLLQYKSNRGQGRNYSLKHCPDRSLTAYVDLDTRYNEAFHGLLEWAPRDKVTHTYTFFGIRKEEFMKRGGWSTINVSEDVEAVSRIGFDYFVPVIVKENLFRGKGREKRYSKGIKYLVRRFNNIVDGIRGDGFYWKDISVYYENKKYVVLPFYIIARIKGIYRYHDCAAKIWIIKESIKKLVDPKEIDLDDSFFLFSISTIEHSVVKVDEILQEKFGSLIKFSCNDRLIRYVKNNEGLKRALLSSNLKDVECKEIKE
ncbi:glycosyl transferase family 2 [Candidatus Acidianus copahuensis]|uniref:Glycosyl transferase family 2 n=1 Tax=Candidatus Acidianus copahuensis TaxID=1160895 RepID=A0A031LXZ0_9CREN|nr:glycosyltransferase [Candidatus Acidianus copahuensis]EZQ12023.1 glycosyl transferase family 2 [Candidatus Acidianus copahuensis]